MTDIRRIRASEGTKLRAIRLRALADSPSAFGSTLAETETRPVSHWDNRARDDAAGQNSALFVAEEGDDWIGLVGGMIEEAEDARTSDDGGPVAVVFSMWVDPAYRGHGIGQRLVERVIAWARERGLGTALLWVTESNLSAIALYTRCGFRSTGETQPLPSNPTLLEQKMLLEL